jgi:hypothetical protein
MQRISAASELKEATYRRKLTIEVINEKDNELRRACGGCAESKRELDFSRSAWTQGERRRCILCVNRNLQELMGSDSEDSETDEEEELRAVTALVADSTVADDGTANGYNADDVEALVQQGVDEEADEANPSPLICQLAPVLLYSLPSLSLPNNAG